MVKWRLKILRGDEEFVYGLEIRRIYDEEEKDYIAWVIESRDDADEDVVISKSIVTHGIERDVFKLRAQRWFCEQIKGSPYFWPVIWRLRKDALIEDIKSNGVKQTCKNIIRGFIREFFADWKEALKI